MRSRHIKFTFIVATLSLLFLLPARPVSAQTLGPQERLCDPVFEDCRADVLTYIQQETVEIDMGFWMMTDARYSNALVAAWQRGVKIRLLMDPRCVSEHAACAAQNAQMQNAGLPMRNRLTSGILHWKVAIFASQGQIEFAGANYAPFEMTPAQPWVNYTEEVVYFTNDQSIVHSFMRKFDDLWTSTTEFGNYANVNGPLTRSYPTYSIDPDLNFPPDDSYRDRAIAGYRAETQQIDVQMFRITDEQHSLAMMAAVQRGIPVRLITDETEYRNPDRLWDAYNVDEMFHAGIQVRLDAHQGIDHEKAVLLYSSGLSIFGSSNWTSPSSDSQREHNYFTVKPWIFTWISNQFERKWTNQTGNAETKPFVPLPPDVPVYHEPANGATGVPTTAGQQLSWDAGLWAHNYDIYFGTTPNPPLLETNLKLGPSQSSTDYRIYALPALQPGTTYYWKIVSKTMAFVTAAGPVWSFTTAGSVSGDVPPTVSLTAPASGAVFTAPATINLTASASDSDGTVSKVDFYAGNTLLGTSTASPFHFTWNNAPAGNYSLTAVATDNGNAATTSSAVSITVNPVVSTLPAGFSHVDVGATGAAGDASFSNGTFTVTGAGADVWGTVDAFHYAYETLNGDGDIQARVATIQNVNAWTKAGVMIRNSLNPSAAQAFMFVASSPTKGVNFQRRLADGNASVGTLGSQTTAPRWVRLQRIGNTIRAYESPDGNSWTLVATDTFAMGTMVDIGLAVSSHVAGTNATATFDHVTVAFAQNTPPTVSITSPTNGSTFAAPGNIVLTASASDSDGTIAKVDFYNGTTLIGTDPSSPFSVTWAGVPAGAYSVTAVATDNGGLTTTSAPVDFTVANGNQPPTVSMTSPANGATFTAPATINLAASAGDTDGTIAKVDFFSGTTLIGTANAAPYTFTWSSVAAGSYSITARATDNLGTATTSSPVSITVNNPTSTLPSGWNDSDVGTVPFAGNASFSSGTFSVTGSGADVWGTSDQFHYAYHAMSGNGTIVARVATVQNVAVWVKAGVMIRETLDAGSAQAFMLVSSAKGVAFQRREATNGISVNTAGSTSTAPHWVKLTRSGNTFNAYESADGTNWTLVGTDTIPMGTNVMVGLAVSSHSSSSSATCTFDNVSIQ